MGNFSKNKVYSLFLIFFISFYLFFPSLHALDKYLTTPFKTLLISFYYLLYFISFIVFYFYLRKKKWFVSILSSPVLLFFLLLFLFVLSYLLFDYQLYLQEFEKRGSDASDAMIKAGTNLLQGSHPYLEKTYLKNFDSEATVKAEINLENNSVRLFNLKEIVSEIDDELIDFVI